MSKIAGNVNLLPYNTFGVAAISRQFCTVRTVEDVQSVLQEVKKDNPPLLILGQGANVLFTKDYEGLIIKNELVGRKVINETADSVTLEIGAGENWLELVEFAVQNNWSGIENLAFIPGTVGAAPVQNLAAYGQNFGEVVVSVSGFNLNDLGSLSVLKHSELNLYYRDSVFKHELKDKFIITSVTIKLSKTAHFDTNYHSRYESLEGELAKFAKRSYLPKDIAQAVTNLRKVKLPDWKKLGTAGSFFKNPFVPKAKFAELAKSIRGLQVYPVNHMLYPNPDDPVFKMADMVKIPAGRLLDELGWRGKRIGNVGTFEKHALVVVNHGGASGQEILEFTRKMQEDIKRNYDINLEEEVNII